MFRADDEGHDLYAAGAQVVDAFATGVVPFEKYADAGAEFAGMNAHEMIEFFERFVPTEFY